MRKFFAKWIFGTYVRQFIKKIEGMENIPKEGAYLIVSNHNSMVDGIGIIHVILKKTNRFIGVVTKLRPVRQTRKSLLIKSSVESFAKIFIEFISAWENKVTDRAVSRLRKGKSILIFPEGFTNQKRTLLKARTGAARMAIKSRAKILPIGMINSEKVLPKNAYIPRFEKGTIKIGEPFTLEEYYGKSNDKLALEDATRVIMKKIGTLCGKRYPY